MFTQAKLILSGIGLFVTALIYKIFKDRGEEIDRLNEVNEELTREQEVHSAIKAVDEEVYERYKYQEDQAEEQYEEQIREIYKAVDKPLTPSFLERLRTVQGLQDRPDSPPE